jgi:hypothetical protein
MGEGVSKYLLLLLSEFGWNNFLLLLAADGVSSNFMSFSGKCVEREFSNSRLATGGAKKDVLYLCVEQANDVCALLDILYLTYGTKASVAHAFSKTEHGSYLDKVLN